MQTTKQQQQQQYDNNNKTTLLCSLSAGKSTLLRMLVDERMSTRSQQLATLRNNLEVVFEPVERWQNIGMESGKAINILDLFYSSPERYAYTFQNFVFLTRMVQVRVLALVPDYLVAAAVAVGWLCYDCLPGYHCLLVHDC